MDTSPEGRERRGMPPQVQERIAIGCQPRERFIVYCRQADVEKRRAAIPEDCGDNPLSARLHLENGSLPDRGTERQRDNVGSLLDRSHQDFVQRTANLTSLRLWSVVRESDCLEQHRGWMGV
jgi:hypothetical protein